MHEYYTCLEISKLLSFNHLKNFLRKGKKSYNIDKIIYFKSKYPWKLIWAKEGEKETKKRKSLTYPFKEALNFGVGDGGILLARDELKDEDAKAEDIGLGREGAMHDILGGHVAVGAGDTGEVLWKEAGHAEVCDFGSPSLIEQDVASLDVPMDDGHVCALVQV